VINKNLLQKIVKAKKFPEITAEKQNYKIRTNRTTITAELITPDT